MKKILFAFTALFMLSMVFTSCSSDNDVLSQFSKRKYLKKYKSKNVKYEDKIEERENNLAYGQTEQKQEVTASTQEDVQVLANSVEVNYEQEVKFGAETMEKLSLVKSYAKDYSEWNSYNRDFNYFDMNTKSAELNNYHNSRSVSNSRASDVVLVILCIFLPPVAVVVFEDGVTGNFWLDLVLTLLFWIPGMIYAFLVCFADVSI